MQKTNMFLILFGVSLALTPQIFRGDFLQIDDDFVDEWEAKEGPLVDPPAGHGLPEFSAAPYELTPEEMFVEYYEWQQLEAAAEDEFYAQTDDAKAEANAEYEQCSVDYTTEEEIEQCQTKAIEEEEQVIRAVEDLQTSHAQEEELVEAAMVFIVEEFYFNNGIDPMTFDDVAKEERLAEEQAALKDTEGENLEQEVSTEATGENTSQQEASIETETTGQETSQQEEASTETESATQETIQQEEVGIETESATEETIQQEEVGTETSG